MFPLLKSSVEKHEQRTKSQIPDVSGLLALEQCLSHRRCLVLYLSCALGTLGHPQTSNHRTWDSQSIRSLHHLSVKFFLRFVWTDWNLREKPQGVHTASEVLYTNNIRFDGCRHFDCYAADTSLPPSIRRKSFLLRRFLRKRPEHP